MVGASKLATRKAVMVTRNLTHRAVDEACEGLRIKYDGKKESCHVNDTEFKKDQVLKLYLETSTKGFKM